MKNIKKKFINHKKQQILPPDLNYKYFENCNKHPFQPKAKQFSLVNAWWLAESSFLAYAPEGFISEQVKKAGMISFRFFNSEKCKCFVSATKDYAIVAFRGTATDSFDFFTDWIDNLNIKLIDFKYGGKVHSGFYNAFKDIQKKEIGFFDYLLFLKKKYKRIRFWFTGHSQGAAVAVIAAKFFQHCQALYTFGSPKVGNSDFCDCLDFPIYRFVQYHDIITSLPPVFDSDKKKDYKHAGIVKFIDKNTVLLDEIKFSEIPLTKTIKVSSRIIDIIFDKEKSILTKIQEVKTQEIPDNKQKLPKTWISRFLNKVRNFLLINRGFSIRNHYPVFYAVHLWNIYIRSIN